MIVHYPTDPAVTTALPEGTGLNSFTERAGKVYWHCDVASCDADAELSVTEVPDTCPNCGEDPKGSRFCPECGFRNPTHSVPDGWVTSDPDDDATAGAAQFCPKHKSNVPDVPADAPPPVVEDSEG